MPHLTLEFTDNIEQSVDFEGLFSSLHRILSEVGGISIGNCKSRAVKLDRYYVAQGETGRAFVHLDVAFLQGRSPETRKEIGRRMLEVLRDRYAESIAGLDLQITIEIREMDRDLYFKIPEGTL